MCGIVGVINFAGKYQTMMEPIMKQLLWLDTIRGDDATGLYALRKDGKIDWCKEVVDGKTFIDYNTRAQDILRDAENHRLILGHNRAGTMGSNNVECAHPILVENKIGLVHNGTLTSWPTRPWAAAKPKEDEDEHDSTAIAKIIAKKGIQYFVNSCYGAYSLVWHDIKKNTVHFLRNEERPMAMVYTEQCVFFGSEIGLLMWVIQRNNLRPLKHFFTKPMVHYTFEMGEPEPKEELIRKNWSYQSAGQRFPDGRSSDLPNHGGAITPIVGRDTIHRPHDDDDVSAMAIRSQREAARLAQALREREEEITEETQENFASQGREGTRISRRATVHPISTGKPHGKSLQKWKSFSVKEHVLFSCINYGEIFMTDKGARYNIEGELNLRSDFPEIIVKGVVVNAALSREKIQSTDKFLWGTIRHILALEHSGNVVLWVEDVRESKVEDPELKRNPRPAIIIANEDGEIVGEVKGDDEQAEVTVLAPTGKSKQALLLQGKEETCQSCKETFPKSRLRFLEEQYEPPSPNSKPLSTTFRFCDSCCETYANDRKTIVPIAVADRLVRSTTIKGF